MKKIPTIIVVLLAMLSLTILAAPRRAVLRKHHHVQTPGPTLPPGVPDGSVLIQPAYPLLFGTDITTATTNDVAGDSDEWVDYELFNSNTYYFVYQGSILSPTVQVFPWTANFCCGVTTDYSTFDIPLNPDGSEEYTLTVYEN